MGARKLGVLVVLAALLAGCGSTTNVGAAKPSGGGLRDASSGLLGHPDFCSRVLPKMREARIPSGFKATAAYDCSTHVVALPGRGLWWVDDEQRATVGVAHLADVLERPDQPTPSDISCASVLVLVTPFVLVTPGGGLVRARVPLDECDSPQPATMNALDALHWSLVHRTVVKQVETPAEQVSGCASAWKDLFDIDASSFTPASTAPLPASSSVLACAYRDTDPAINHPVGSTSSDIEVGAFTGWARLRGGDEATLLRGLDGGRQTTTCGVKHSGFVVLSPASNSGRYDLVELGGCGRVLRESVAVSGHVARETEQIGQAGPAALALLRRLLSAKA